VAVTGLWVIFSSQQPFDLDYTSQELLDHLYHWVDTGLLYSNIDESPFRVLNYPPLFLFLAKMGTLISYSPLFWGRALNLFAFLITLGVTYKWLNLQKSSSYANLFFISLIACSFPAIYFLGQFHLEYLGIALSLWGLYLLKTHHGFFWTFASGALMGLACFSKQVQVVPMIVAGLWVLRYRPRQLIPLILGSFVIGLIGMGILDHSFGKEIWQHLIVYTVGTYSWKQLGLQMLSYGLPWILFFIMSLGLAIKMPVGRKDLSWWFLLGTSIWLFATARTGAGGQYFIQWNIAIILWLGTQIPFLFKKYQIQKPIKTYGVLFFIIQIFLADMLTVTLLTMKTRTWMEQSQVLSSLCEALPQEGMLIPSENPGIIRYCGDVPALHPFIMANLAKRGLWNEQNFIDKVQSGEYSIILLPFSIHEGPKGYQRERWTPQTLKSILANYSQEKQMGPWYLLRPSSN
jgi:hypothetical protein